MALTPEDVVNKRFNPTKFREGYDQDEVDDFLDEVVVELRRLNQENEELRQRLVAGESRIAELQRAGAQAAQQAPAAVVAPVVAPAPAAAPEPMFAPQAVDAGAMDPSNTNNLLQLARRLHEEHVREGMEKRDALIAEGHATAARVVSEAQQSQQAALGQLDQERQSLERKIEELRTFERDYRQKLRGYIEGQLRDLESSNALTAGPSASAVPTTAAPTAAPTGEQSTGEQTPVSAPTPQTAAPQYQVAAPAAPAGYGAPQVPDYAAYPQPTDYPGFAAGN